MIAQHYLRILERKFPAEVAENSAAKKMATAPEKHENEALQEEVVAVDLPISTNYEEDEDEVLAGDLSVLINTEVAHNWQNNQGAKNEDLSFSTYSLAGVQITEKIDVQLEMNLNTQGTGEYLAFKKPIVSVDSLTLAYQTDFFGVGLGKFDLLSESDLVSPIWGRQLSLFSSLPNQAFDLSGAVGLRTWLNLEEIYDQEHYVYLSAFFIDDTRLAKPFINNSVDGAEDFSGVGFTRKLNNFALSLHGELPISEEDWSYAIGAAKLQASNQSQKDETTLFAGIYGDNDLPSQRSVAPYVEFLYQNNAAGENINAYSGLAGVSYEAGNWYYGGSLSYQHLSNKNTRQASNTKEAQVYISHYFDFGGYLDFGYQFIYEDKKNNNQLALSFGIPIETNYNFYGKTKTRTKETQLNDIKKIIRR